MYLRHPACHLLVSRFCVLPLANVSGVWFCLRPTIVTIHLKTTHVQVSNFTKLAATTTFTGSHTKTQTLVLPSLPPLSLPVLSKTTTRESPTSQATPNFDTAKWQTHPYRAAPAVRAPTSPSTRRIQTSPSSVLDSARSLPPPRAEHPVSSSTHLVLSKTAQAMNNSFTDRHRRPHTQRRRHQDSLEEGRGPARQHPAGLYLQAALPRPPQPGRG